MTSKLTRDRLQEIAEDGFLKHGESKELARMALAAMGSEPVAWTDEEELRDANKGGSGYLFGIGHDANKFADLRRQIMLYRHAQPAPVVPDFKKLALELVDNLVDCGGVDEGVKERYLEWAEKTCRAAMLAAAPQEVNAWSSHHLPVTRGDAVGCPFNREEEP